MAWRKVAEKVAETRRGSAWTRRSAALASKKSIADLLAKNPAARLHFVINVDSVMPQNTAGREYRAVRAFVLNADNKVGLRLDDTHHSVAMELTTDVHLYRNFAGHEGQSAYDARLFPCVEATGQQQMNVANRQLQRVVSLDI